MHFELGRDGLVAFAARTVVCNVKGEPAAVPVCAHTTCTPTASSTFQASCVLRDCGANLAAIRLRFFQWTRVDEPTIHDCVRVPYRRYHHKEPLAILYRGTDRLLVM
jgi:hypothetical protein